MTDTQKLIAEARGYAERCARMDFTDDADFLTRLADALEEATVWRPTETAPKDGSRIVLLWSGGQSAVGYYLDNSRKAFPWAGWRVADMVPMPRGLVTGWLPLPPAPQRETTDE